jgi:formamidopyrimidine-DNA glycosylase
MPELPEVEVLARHLRPMLKGRTVRRVRVNRAKVLAPTTVRALRRALIGARFCEVTRRGKYLLFELVPPEHNGETIRLLGHLGMTGRMYVLAPEARLPKHAAVILDLGRERFVYEDTRYFGRLTLDLTSLERLGPEPWDKSFTAARLTRDLRRSRQAIKVKLLDQSLVAGVGNIYASEALFRAGISPRLRANRLTAAQVGRLWRALRRTLADAIEGGSTVPLDFAGVGSRDGLYYYGRPAGTADYYEERLRVYDRAGEPCGKCRAAIRRIVQAARSTYFCPRCQR